MFLNNFATEVSYFATVLTLKFVLASKRREQILHSKMHRFIQWVGSTENIAGGTVGTTGFDVEGW